MVLRSMLRLNACSHHRYDEYPIPLHTYLRGRYRKVRPMRVCADGYNPDTVRMALTYYRPLWRIGIQP